MFLWIGFILIMVAIFPYIIYFIGIHLARLPDSQIQGLELPMISIIISAYNEEKVITNRIENIRASTYPIEKYEVIFVDDCSTDNTLQSAESAFKHAGISYRAIRNTERLGTNLSYNMAIAEANYPIIVTTDANKYFEENALVYLIERLISDDTIAAVSGEQYPVVGASSRTAQVESAYRNYYGRMCSWESSVDSTYNFNGPIVGFKKDIIASINDQRGADDANTAFEAIRRGYRSVYEPKAVVYEEIPENFTKQYRQKIRRATRLIEATIANINLLGTKRPFSRFFFPLRIMMYVVTPLLFFIGCAFFMLGCIISYPIVFIGIAGIFVISHFTFKTNIFSAFVLNQFYLFMGLLNLGKDVRIWEK